MNANLLKKDAFYTAANQHYSLIQFQFQTENKKRMLDSALNLLVTFLFFSLLIEKKVLQTDISILSYIKETADLFFDFVTRKLKIRGIINIIIVSFLLVIILKTLLFMNTMTKRELDSSINYLTVMLDTTETSMELKEFPPKFFKAIQLSAVSAAAFIFKFYIFIFFMLNRKVGAFSFEVNSIINAFAAPVKKIMYKVKVFDFISDENLAAVIFCQLIFIILFFLIRADYNFHQFVNIMLAGFFNMVNVIEFILIIIICAYIFAHSQFPAPQPLKNFFIITAETFNKPLRNLFGFKIGKIDILPFITIILLYFVNIIFNAILLNIFKSYNINILN